MSRKSKRHGRAGRPPSRTEGARPPQEKIDKAIALCEKGLALYRSEQYEQAVATIQEAADTVQEIDNAHYVLALCYQKLGRIEEAVTAAEQELKLNPRRPKAKSLAEELRVRIPQGGKRAINIKFDVEDAPEPEPRPSVSLCMIVKDEEEHLAGCLESVGDFPDEIIVVDTGSTDRTVEIARSFGARVEHFPWIDDFAAARNESIKYATKDWIFWMDADDRVSPENLKRLKYAAATGQADVYACRVVSEVGDSSSRKTGVHKRLFRNRIGLHFRGAIHERLFGSDPCRPVSIAYTNIEIEHVGYAVDQRQLVEKARRNKAIIERCLEQEPERAYWRYHLAVVMSMLEEWEKAIEHLEVVIEDQSGELGRDVEVYDAHLLLATAYEKTQRPEEAHRSLQRLIEEFPQRRHAWMTLGRHHLSCDQPEEAAKALERARTLPAESDSLGVSWPEDALERDLSTAHLLVGDLTRAREAYQRTLALQGHSLAPAPAELLARASRLVRQGQHQQAVEVLEPYAAADREALRLLATACCRAGRWQEAATFMSRAVTMGEGEEADWVSLAEILVQTGNIRAAKRFCGLALNGDDDCAPALNLLGVAAMAEGQAPEALARFLDAAIADPGYAAARTNLQELCSKAGLSAGDAAKQEGGRSIQRGDLHRAAVALALAVDMAPDDAEAHKLLAFALRQLGREEDALACWRLAQGLEKQAASVASG